MLGAALLVLEALCQGGLIPAVRVPAPSTVAISAGAILQSGAMVGQFARTLAAVAAAAILALVSALLVGAGLVARPRLRALVEPLLASCHAIPVFVCYPLLVVAFGPSRLSLVAVGYLLAAFSVAIGAVDDVRGLRGVSLDHGPPIRPTHAVSGAFAGVVGAELVLPGDGVGHEIAFAFNNFDNGTTYALTLILIAIATAVHASLGAWERRHASPPRQTARAVTSAGAGRSVTAGLMFIAVLVMMPLGVYLGPRGIWPQAADTSVALAQGYALAAVIGLPAGLLLDAHRPTGAAAEPLLAAIAWVPTIAVYPVVLIALGIGLTSQVVFGAANGLAPIALAALRAARTGGPARGVMAFSGLRAGFAFTLAGTIAGEMFVAEGGLGGVVMHAVDVHDVRTLLAVTLMLVAFAVACGGLLLRVDRDMQRATVCTSAATQ